jgi:membrane-associated phospholipid phosphatase
MDSRHGFQFGFLKGGIFWGWPSGHTTVAFSMALCLTNVLPQEQINCLLHIALRVLRPVSFGSVGGGGFLHH